MNEVLPVISATVERSNAILMRGCRTRPRADRKGEIDFVTEYDKESERVLAKGLAPLGFGMVLEESGGTPTDATLYVDPLDGTTNFLHGHPFFCVSVGLLVDDAPCLGVECAGAGDHLGGRSWCPGDAKQRDLRRQSYRNASMIRSSRRASPTIAARVARTILANMCT